MKLTKYGHSCFILEEKSEKLIVDPGIFTTLPNDISNIKILIITHNHPDHFNPDSVQAIMRANQDIKIFAPNDIAKSIGADIPEMNEVYRLGKFELNFYKSDHAYIREDFELPNNFGVVINKQISYPGDSYSISPINTKYLLTPISAPWAKMKDTEEFIIKSSPEVVIAVHDAILSDKGYMIYDSHLKAISEKNGIEYLRLKTEESIEA